MSTLEGVENLLQIIQKIQYNIIKYLSFEEKNIDNISIFISSELEFYYEGWQKDEEKIVILQKKIDSLNNIWKGQQIEQLEKEDGNGQFEIQFIPTKNPLDLILGIDFFKKHFPELNFKAKPYKNEPSSGLHWHISIYYDNDNLFSETFKEDEDGLLKYSIAGLLCTMNQNMKIFCPTEECYDRLLFPKNTQYILYPTNCSWGYNNRTCAIRIPTKPSSGSFGKDCRIEHRVCSPVTNPLLSLNSIFYGINYGIENMSHCPQPIYGNAFDHIYNYIDNLPKSLKDAEKY